VKWTVQQHRSVYYIGFCEGILWYEIIQVCWYYFSYIKSDWNSLPYNWFFFTVINSFHFVPAPYCIRMLHYQIYIIIWAFNWGNLVAVNFSRQTSLSWNKIRSHFYHGVFHSAIKVCPSHPICRGRGNLGHMSQMTPATKLNKVLTHSLTQLVQVWVSTLHIWRKSFNMLASMTAVTHHQERRMEIFNSGECRAITTLRDEGQMKTGGLKSID